MSQKTVEIVEVHAVCAGLHTRCVLPIGLTLFEVIQGSGCHDLDPNGLMLGSQVGDEPSTNGRASGGCGSTIDSNDTPWSRNSGSRLVSTTL